jgi:hypothetical protein
MITAVSARKQFLPNEGSMPFNFLTSAIHYFQLNYNVKQDNAKIVIYPFHNPSENDLKLNNSIKKCCKK